MTRRARTTLRERRATFGSTIRAVVAWRDDESFEIGGIEYVCRPMGGRFPSEPGRFCLVKAPWQVEWYEKLLRELAPRTILEIGTWDGASAALFAELVRPKKLVTVDRRPESSAALADFMTSAGFAGTVAAYCNVDQGDTGRLREILGAEFAGEPLDLVIDDASHLVDLTRRTFNCVFPRLRPGGTYVIEDWSWAHTAILGPWSESDEIPLTVVVFELILACAHRPNVVENVDVYKNWAVVTRGDAELDAETFDISTCYGPKARALVRDL